MGGAVGGLYLWNKATDGPHKKEAGILSGEAAANALLVTGVVKYSFGRERPTADASRSRFWQVVTHSLLATPPSPGPPPSMIAHEYPGLLTKIFAYGAASAISISRVEGKRHFPSDALVGSGMAGLLDGWRLPDGQLGWPRRSGNSSLKPVLVERAQRNSVWIPSREGGRLVRAWRRHH